MNGKEISSPVANILSPVGQLLNAEAAAQILKHRLHKDTVKRIQVLAKKASLGKLTFDESTEYDSINNALDTLAILKSEARATIKQSHG
ncbi:hypothetical protein BH11PLA2_BH11PLA2_19540 [soil metagenome]